MAATPAGKEAEEKISCEGAKMRRNAKRVGKEQFYGAVSKVLEND
jgi:hypothetical protein